MLYYFAASQFQESFLYHVVYYLQLLLTMMDVENPDKPKRTITHEGHVNQEEESTEVTANKEAEQKQIKEVVGKLLTPCVLTLRTSLQDRKYVSIYWPSFSTQDV